LVSAQGAAGVLIVAVAAEGAVRVIGVEVGAVAVELAERHQLRSHGARLAAETLVAAALMSSHIKGEERLTLQIQAEQPPCAVFAEADAAGNIRGRLTPAHLHCPDARLNGLLAAIKSTPTGEMYRGVTAVEDATIEEALMEHLRQSTQLDGVLKIRSDMVNGSARGVLVERLPGHGNDRAAAIRAISVIEVLKDRSPQEVLEAVAQGHLLGEPLEVLHRRSLNWVCRCSRDRVLATLMSLDAVELQSMAEEDHGAEITCHFCKERYVFDEDTIRGLAVIED
jgi:molecular chaperone Hsp33